MQNPVPIGGISCGNGQPITLIAGPCVLESAELATQVAERLVGIAQRLGWNLIFKGSFDKANRTSVTSYRGPGLEAGLKILEKIGTQFQVPTTTDFHESSQAAPVAQVCDLLQVPAFLARQTDLLFAAAQTGKAINVKKGQFMAPQDMRHVVNKIRESGGDRLILTERGTTFGYGLLVNDFRGLSIMRQTGVPVCFDATHSVQMPSAANGTTGGMRSMVPLLARAAVAVGVDALFLETHPDPDNAKSDGPNMVPLDQLEMVLQACERIRQAVGSHPDSTAQES